MIGFDLSGCVNKKCVKINTLYFFIVFNFLNFQLLAKMFNSMLIGYTENRRLLGLKGWVTFLSSNLIEKISSNP